MNPKSLPPVGHSYADILRQRKEHRAAWLRSLSRANGGR